MKSCQEQPETCAVVWNNEEKLPFSHSDVNQPETLGAGALVQHLVLHSCPRKGLEGGEQVCGRKERRGAGSPMVRFGSGEEEENGEGRQKDSEMGRSHLDSDLLVPSLLHEAESRHRID